ncbi:hypothetical protein FH972_001839 [Carpinus fangiana]|uniref:Bulb-type lectin domain-containing protein n=1 Tax=Carpinus fangiana TaxID=176857 RepID=A0A5N6QFM7_9ROSI|nr:hypothetical protein FH972_001839 [Carpinus fangiana]
MDSGNLVFSDDDHELAKVQWESFKDPTDTFLPGMNIHQIWLISWKSEVDPGLGQFTFKQDQQEGNYVISKEPGVDYWRNIWIGGSSDEMPDGIDMLTNLSNSGNFSYESCNINNWPFVCKCLPGFHPTNQGN